MLAAKLIVGVLNRINLLNAHHAMPHVVEQQVAVAHHSQQAHEGCGTVLGVTSLKARLPVTRAGVVRIW